MHEVDKPCQNVRCQRCNQSIYGQYGSWATDADPTQPQEARDKLAKFFKLEVQDGGKRQV